MSRCARPCSDLARRSSAVTGAASATASPHGQDDHVELMAKFERGALVTLGNAWAHPEALQVGKG